MLSAPCPHLSLLLLLPHRLGLFIAACASSPLLPTPAVPVGAHWTAGLKRLPRLYCLSRLCILSLLHVCSVFAQAHPRVCAPLECEISPRFSPPPPRSRLRIIRASASAAKARQALKCCQITLTLHVILVRNQIALVHGSHATGVTEGGATADDVEREGSGGSSALATHSPSSRTALAAALLNFITPSWWCW